MPRLIDSYNNYRLYLIIMKKIILSILLVFICCVGYSQSISVGSFRLLESDLTANTAGTMEQDQNGETAALIKVVTTQTGFTFDGGSLGIVKTKQTPGEVWVYVPRGSKKITIKHPQLGVLRDYYYPIAIDAARTYEMALTTGTVQTIVKQARTSQYVVFQLTPADAVVELNGELLKTEDGVASKMMKFGTYNYRVQAPNYLMEVGAVTIDDPNNKKVVNVPLKPNFSQVTINVGNDAEIWVNGEKKGTGSWTGNLGAGTYELEAKKQGHRSTLTTKDIVVTSTPQTITLQSPIPIYGEADINSTPAMADIYIDGQKRGQTPQLIDQLLVGEHQLRISRQGYTDYNGTFTINESETANVNTTLTKQATQLPTSPVNSASSDQKRVITVNGVSFTMIRVDGGTFQMGATKEQKHPQKDEKPTHQVTLSTYYIGETEVTQELWQTVMDSNPSNFKGRNRPVEEINWNACHEFLRKLNEETGLQFRLPTEAEWEFAARGGIMSQGYRYSGSNNLDDVAWYTNNSRGSTHNVKMKQPNELGLYDMSGNVWEWCQDRYNSYSSEAQTNPTGALSGAGYVCRGGSWNDSTNSCQVAVRDYYAPASPLHILGMRLVLQ